MIRLLCALNEKVSRIQDLPSLCIEIGSISLDCFWDTSWNSSG